LKYNLFSNQRNAKYIDLFNFCLTCFGLNINPKHVRQRINKSIYCVFRWLLYKSPINISCPYLDLLLELTNLLLTCLFSRFRREVDENCVLLGYYAASSGNSLPTFRYHPKVKKFQKFLTLEDGTDSLSQNDGK
jgi:hypothetical protein